MNNIPGYITQSELAAFRTMFASYNTPDAVGVEIGSLHGRSSYEIAKTVNQATLYCIDGWSNYDSSNPKFTDSYAREQNWPTKGTLCSMDFFMQNVRDCPNIKPIKGHSPGCVKQWKELVDFVFLDALHANPSDWDNITFWLPKIKKGGIMSGHDFYSNRQQWPDVHDNVRKLEQQLNQSVVNPPGTGIWYFVV